MSDEETTARLAGLTTRLEELEQLVDDLQRAAPAAGTAATVVAGTGSGTGAGESSGGAVDARPLYPSAEMWVTRHFLLMYQRRTGIGGRWRWCDDWWRHPEAISRFEALWRTWELARLDPAGIAGWYREHLDHHLPILLGEDGPFRHCEPSRDGRPVKHEDDEPLRAAPSPAGWWGEAEEDAGQE